MENKLAELNTKRLVLRGFSREDQEAVHAYSSIPENTKYMIWGPNSETDTKYFLEDCIKKVQEDPITDFEYAITLKDSGKLIGGCGIYLKGKETAMLGWILHQDYWRQGYVAEAGEALLEYGFHVLNLHRIYATCNVNNYGSFRVMEKLGMRREAHFVKSRYGRVGDGKDWYDEYHYGILKEEYEKKGKECCYE